MDLYSADQGTNIEKILTRLPYAGETLYARLFAMFGGSWRYNDYVYTACDFRPQMAVMQSPAPGSVLGSATETFAWSDVGATQYWLRIGTMGVGSFDIYSATQGTNTSRIVTGLPTGGQTLYVRLFTMIDGDWCVNDYTYTATGP